MKTCIFSVSSLILLLASCSNCRPPEGDEYTSITNHLHIQTISNLQNKQFVFKNQNGIIDTVSFGPLKHENIVSSGSKCNGPHQTCCNKSYMEFYIVGIKSKKYLPPPDYEISLDSRTPSDIDTDFLEIHLTDSVEAVKYKNETLEDAFIDIDTVSQDTNCLISVSKGLIMYRNYYGKWHRF